MKAKILYEKILPLGTFRTYAERPETDLVRTNQIHSSALIPYKGDPLDEAQVDGVVFKYDTLRSVKTSVAVTTADCMPVLFLGDKSGVFLHAGWRGLAGGILTNPLIAEIQPYYAFIGPSIHQNAFEVKKDFESHFPEREFYRLSDGKMYFDLQAKAAKQIKLEYPDINLEISEQCTFELEKYHSYRRDKTKDRNWNIFTP